MMDVESSKRRYNPIKWFQANFQKIIIILVSILYIAQGAFNFTKNEASLIDVLGSAALSIAIGVTISSGLRSSGLQAGRRSDIFLASMRTYGEAKVKATPFFDKLPTWCTYKNNIDLYEKRKDIIQRGGLHWQGFIHGYYDTRLATLSKEQVKVYYRAKNASITKLVANELLSDLPTNKYPKLKFGISEQTYKHHNVLMDVLTKIVISLTGAYYVLEPIVNQEGLANIIWHTMQIVLWIALGMLKYYEAQDFMENEYRQTHIVQKTEYLNEFIITMQNNPKIIETVEDNTGITQDIEQFLREKGVLNGRN